MTLLEMKSHFQQCNLYIPFKMFLKKKKDSLLMTLQGRNM